VSHAKREMSGSTKSVEVRKAKMVRLLPGPARKLLGGLM